MSLTGRASPTLEVGGGVYSDIDSARICEPSRGEACPAKLCVQIAEREDRSREQLYALDLIDDHLRRRGPFVTFGVSTQPPIEAR